MTAPAKRWLTGLSLLILGSTLMATSSWAEETLWVRIHHPASDPAVQQLGRSEPLHDYSGFQWGQLPASLVETLKAQGLRISTSRNPFELTLGGRRFDPVDERELLASPHANAAGDWHLIQFDGPIRPAWTRALIDSGVQLAQPLHPFSYLVWADSAQINAARSLDRVRFVGLMQSDWKIQAGPARTGSEPTPSMLLISAHIDSQALTRRLESFGPVHSVSPYNRHFQIVYMDAPADRHQQLAELNGVYTVQLIPPEAGPRGEMSNQSITGGIDLSGNVVPGYDSWLTATGFSGAGVLVSVVDGGIRESHQDLTGNTAACVSSGDTPTSCSSANDNHGSHVAGAIAGTGASGTLNNGFLRGQGVAPGARVIQQRYPAFLDGSNATDGFMIPDGMLKIFRESALSGALLANNSWGPTGSPQGYDIPTQQIDFISRDADPATPGDQPILAVWSVMNGNGDASTGSCAPSSLGSPDEAKNLFAVGSTSLQSSTGAQLTNIYRVSANSAHGPACDGRTVPHIVAPGCRTDSICSGGTGNCNTNTSYGLACGTSMASPVVSGAVALWAQKYIANEGVNPSPALAKAVFTAAAQDLVGNPNADGGIMGHRPDRFQGYGRVDLDLVMNHGLEVFTFDQSEVFTSSGQDWSVGLLAVDPDQPIRIMLAWTDAPGHGLGGSTPAWVNNLDLVVEAGGNTYLGNVIGGDGWSSTGGSADDRNNLEGVFLSPAQHGGAVIINVNATDLNGDALSPWNPGAPSQDFALACYNCTLTGAETFSLSISPESALACAPDSGLASTQAVINVAALSGYTGTVALSASNLPAGVVSSFDPASVVVPGQSDWTLSIDQTAVPGAYSLTVSGDDGSDLQERGFGLLLEPPPVATELLLPANGSLNTELRPDFSWEAIDGIDLYTVQLATDSEFNNLVIDEQVADRVFTPSSDLAIGTEYFWRVRSENSCGGSDWTTAFSFTTRLEPVAQFSASSIEVSLPPGITSSTNLTISNIGTGNLDWAIDVDSGAVLLSSSREFEGTFDPANWTLINQPSNVGGEVSTSAGPPIEVYLTGGNNNAGGYTDWQIEIEKDGTISFDWGYQSSDSGNFDQGGFAINGTFNELADNDSQVPFFNGSELVQVSAGDLFAFRVSTLDGQFGPGLLGVTNFNFTANWCDQISPSIWLSVSPTSGSVAESQSDDISLNFDTTDLAEGEYQAYLCITTNDPNAAEVEIPVTLTVDASATQAGVELLDLVQTYTGVPLGISVVTDPPDLVVEVSYDGQPDLPVNAGSYAVEATVVDAVWTGSASGTFLIEPAIASLELLDLEQVFTGDPREATINVTPSGLNLIVTYDGSTTPPSAIGNYSLEATVDETNYIGSASDTFRIVPDYLFFDRFEQE